MKKLILAFVLLGLSFSVKSQSISFEYLLGLYNNSFSSSFKELDSLYDEIPPYHHYSKGVYLKDTTSFINLIQDSLNTNVIDAVMVRLPEEEFNRIKKEMKAHDFKKIMMDVPVKNHTYFRKNDLIGSVTQNNQTKNYYITISKGFFTIGK